MAKKCKHEFTIITMRDGSKRYGRSLAIEMMHPTDGCQASDLRSAKCQSCEAQLALGESNEAPVAVEVRAAEIAVASDSDPDLTDFVPMDWIGWDAHDERVVDEVNDKTSAGWLAREIATHDHRDTRDADAWPWDPTRPAAVQYEEWLAVSNSASAEPGLRAAAADFLAGMGSPISEQTRHDVAASVVRHAEANSVTCSICHLPFDGHEQCACDPMAAAHEAQRAADPDCRDDDSGFGHWPDCALRHGGDECDMGPECGSPTTRDDDAERTAWDQDLDAMEAAETEVT